MKSKSSIWLGYDVKTQPGTILRPSQINFWKQETYQRFQPQPPFLFKADALVGLSLLLLNKEIEWPNASRPNSREFTESVWNELEPHQELFLRSQNRIQALRSTKLTNSSKELYSEFETEFSNQLAGALSPQGVDCIELESLIETMDFLEAKMKRNLLFNFDLRFSPDFVRSLQYLYSFLFHVRNLMVMDFNSRIQDPCYEALKIDSVSDYLPHADYLANDAVLYFLLKKQVGQQKLPDLKSLFFKYSQSGATLIESLAPDFLNSLEETQLSEALYLIQMDWMFGTEAGLLYRIREELFGIREGYEQVFYRDLDHQERAKSNVLSTHFEIKASDLFPNKSVA